ncbi:MAG: hypothetical protein LBP78_02950 [Acidaminococcales bacterium]|nr:hypothetical protein [Acidaminococcales bacterium]
MHVEQIFDNIFRVAMPHKSDVLSDAETGGWAGNYAHWNELLLNIYNISTVKMKKWVEDSAGALVNIAAQSKREVIFWGCGTVAQRLLPYFLRGGIVPKFYDRNKAIMVNENYEMIAKDRFLPYPEDYFIVVTPRIGSDAIIAELESGGFKKNVGYCVPPISAVLFYQTI